MSKLTVNKKSPLLFSASEAFSISSTQAVPAGFNDLTNSFKRELNFRTYGGDHPRCLFVDVKEGGAEVSLLVNEGAEFCSVDRSVCLCFAERACQPQSILGGNVFTCNLLTQAQTEKEFDLVMSCHSLSFLPYARARCFLHRLRSYINVGGMLFISVLGRYSCLADDYPLVDEPLETRFGPLSKGASDELQAGTPLCLYSERELCATLFHAGWSVLRSSTTTESNVIATAIRL